MKYKNLPGRLPGTVGLWLLTVILYFLSIPVWAVTGTSFDENIQEPYIHENNHGENEKDRNPKKEKDKVWETKFNEIIEFLNNRKDELYPVDFGVDVSFNGHKAGESNLFKLNIKADLVNYQYPGEFSFKVGTSLQFRDNSVQEDVTTLLVKYDYYFEPWLEVYGFAERFSDSFLSIQHRYEIGGGIKLEANLWERRSEKNREREKYEDYLKIFFRQNRLPGLAKAASLQKFIRKKVPSYFNSARKADELVKEEKCFYDILKRRYARVSAGLAVTVLAELEKAEIETYIDEKVTGEDGATSIREGNGTTKFPLKGEQRFRIVLRPRVIANFGDNIFLKGLIYLKYPLGKPQKSCGRLDYRYDALLRAELKVMSQYKWLKNVSLFFEYQRHYDNIPPRLPESLISECLASGKILHTTCAYGTHEAFSCGIKLQL